MGQGYLDYVKPFLPTLLVIVGWFLQPYGKIGDVYFFITTLLSLIVATFYAFRIGVVCAKQNEASRMKQFLSHQRHDWMNDVQIMLGYLSLQKNDRMKKYLEQQVQKANNERLITQLQYAPLVVFLITLPQRYLQWTTNIKIENIAEYTIQEEKTLLVILDDLFPWLENQFQDVMVDLQLHMHISKNKKLTLKVSFVEEWVHSSIVRMNDFSYIQKRIKKENGELSFDRDRNEVQIVIT